MLLRDDMQQGNERSTTSSSTAASPALGNDTHPMEFAEPIPEYLCPGYRALMAGDASSAITQWQALYDRYPSAEVCSHIARAYYYQSFFLGHGPEHARHCDHIAQMRLWAERALGLNANSAIGHALLAAAMGRQAQVCSSQREAIRLFWIVREHATRSILIADCWIGHMVMGIWHREMASVNVGLRALANLFRLRLPEGTLKESLYHFNEILKQYPENNTIYAEMALTYERVNDHDRARQMYEKCLTMPLFRHPLAPYLTEQARARYRRLLEIS